ncbi:terminase large subunit [Terribacillus saccharophilus]|uniref:terminase large subunit n=1 Tax=Terribacillus saccharophilus TaxID=361277 RepID=UPI002DD405C6|nr:terminase large subunit [Terribacillus saccharophilus]MEC0288816.1 terminase large subunit [Terribacillus saccharophilus]
MTASTISKKTSLPKGWYQRWLIEQKQKGHILEAASNRLLTTWYAEKLVADEILASKKNVMAARRHLNDLKKQGTDDFPWIFVEDKGHRPIRFIEKFCRPSKGDFKSLVIQPWQHFILGSIYGWVHKVTGIRRFREAIEFVGRKNGKSTMISGVANYAVSKDGENGADVYLLANSKQQASIIFDEAKAMVKKSPPLRKRYQTLRFEIKHPESFSKIEARASDSEKLDGLNTHLGVFDEIHEFKDYKLINIIKKSRGSRKQPLILYITTAGYQLDGPLVNYYEQGADVLEEVIDDDRTFYFLAELDSEEEFENPKMWIKANPNMGVSLDLETLIEDWNKDKRTPSERTDFITKQFNVFVNAAANPFLEFQVLKRNEKVIDMEMLKGKVAIGGYDLSSTEDFTSACLEFPLLDTGEVFVLSHSWIPQRKVNEGNEKIPYQEFAEAGYLTIVPGDYVNEEAVFDWFVEQSELYNAELITYDPANAFRLNKALEAHGFQTEITRQGYVTLSPALKDLKNLFIDGKVISNKNPLLRWYINNVELIKDRNGNLLPTKTNRYRKIDGFAALLNAHTRVMERLVEPAGNGDISVVSLADLMN